MKRTISIAAIAVLSISLLAGCSKQSSKQTTENSEPSGKVKVWAWDPNFNIAIMNEAVDRYKVDHPDVTIEVVEMAKADVEQKLHTALAANTKEGLPEIVLIEDYNGQKYLQSYPGKFADLTNEFNFEDFAAYKTKVMTVDNKVYGVPFDSGVGGFFYRKDLLAESGYQASDLENITWKQFIEIGKVVKEKTGKYFCGFDKTDGGVMRLMLQSAGQWYFDQDGKPALTNNPVIKEIVELYKEIELSGISKPTAGWDAWVSAFNNGETATVTSGVWIVGSIKAAADQSGLWAVAPIPRLESQGSINASNLGGSSWYILNDAGNKSTAIDFMKTIYGADKEFYQTILMKNGAIGSYLPGTSGDAYDQADPFFDNVAIYQDLSKWAKEIIPVDYGCYTYEADTAILSQMDAICSGAMTVDEGIEAAQKQLENAIQE